MHLCCHQSLQFPVKMSPPQMCYLPGMLPPPSDLLHLPHRYPSTLTCSPSTDVLPPDLLPPMDVTPPTDVLPPTPLHGGWWQRQWSTLAFLGQISGCGCCCCWSSVFFSFSFFFLFFSFLAFFCCVFRPVFIFSNEQMNKLQTFETGLFPEKLPNLMSQSVTVLSSFISSNSWMMGFSRRAIARHLSWHSKRFMGVGFSEENKSSW